MWQRYLEIRLKDNEVQYSIFVCIIALLLFVVLYHLRFIDDNSLTSWRLVFGQVSAFGVFALVFAGVVLSYGFSNIALPGPRVLFLIAFASSIVFWREPEVVIDSSRYFTQAKHLGEFGVQFFLQQWGREISPWTDLPLVPFLYGVIFRYLGESRLLIQILTSAMFSFTAVLTVMLGRDLFEGKAGENIGASAGALMLAIPYLYTQVPLMLVDVPGMFLLTLSVFLFNRTMQKGGALLVILSAISIFLALITKFSIWMMLSVLCIVFLLYLRKNPAKALKTGSMVLLFSAMLSGAFFFSYPDVIKEQLDLLVTFQRPGLKWWGESFVSTFLFQVHPFVTFGALYSVFVAFRRKDPKYLVISWLVLLMLFLQVKRARYFIPVFPMFALMAAYGLSDLSSERVRRLVVYCAVTVSFTLAAFAYLPFLEKTSYANLKNAGKFLNTLAHDNVRVLAVPQNSSINPAVSVPLLDIYTDKAITYCFDLLPRMSQEEIDNSSFRFTWTYRNPAYYESIAPDGTATTCSSGGLGDDLIAVIYAGSEDVISRRMKDHRLLERFNRDPGLYNFKTFVNIYEMK